MTYNAKYIYSSTYARFR
ncbi:hypothetical protein [Escherichia coli]